MEMRMTLIEALETARNPHTSQSVLNRLRGKFHPVNCLIAMHPNRPQLYLDGHFDFFNDVLRDEGLCQAFATRCDASPKQLWLLAQRGGWLTRQRVLKHANTTEKTRAWIKRKLATQETQIRDEGDALMAVKRMILSTVRCFQTTWPNYPELMREIKDFAAYHPTGWEPVYETITDTGDDHRKGNLVFAHLFTSIDYPWPYLDGIPLAPLLQLDLRSVHSKSKQSHQLDVLPEMDGLLQVWTTYYKQMSVKDSVVRFVPGDHVRNAAMTNDAPVLANDCGYLALARAGFGCGEGLGARIVAWTKQAPKYIHYPWFRNEPELGPENSLEEYEERLAVGDPTAVAFKEAEILIEKIRTLVEPVSSRGSSHLFGVSAEFQMANAWDDRPWQTLYQFDGDGHPDFRISGFGTASVYWKKDQFRYSWSPYG